MLLSTLTIDMPNKQVIGVVMGTSIRGGGLVKDMAARIADTLGGTATGYERTFSEAVNQAVEEMQRAASNKGAIAIEGLTIAQSPLPMDKGGLFTVLAYGTAIKGDRR